MSMVDPKGSGDASQAMPLIRAHKIQTLTALVGIAAHRKLFNWEDEISQTMAPNQKSAKPGGNAGT